MNILNYLDLLKNTDHWGADKNKEIYEELIHLKKLRHQADYKLEIPQKNSLNYKNWEFTSIISAFEIAEGIIKIFNDFKSF